MCVMCLEWNELKDHTHMIFLVITFMVSGEWCSKMRPDQHVLYNFHTLKDSLRFSIRRNSKHYLYLWSDVFNVYEWQYDVNAILCIRLWWWWWNGGMFCREFQMKVILCHKTNEDNYYYYEVKSWWLNTKLMFKFY